MDKKQETMLRDLQAMDIFLIDLGLYLDTHPCDKEALALYKKYNEQNNKMRSQYQEQYGPLTIRHADGVDYWQWVADPWPWERLGG